LGEFRAGLKTGNLKIASIMLEKLSPGSVHTEETSAGALGEISFKYRAQGNREIRTVGEFSPRRCGGPAVNWPRLPLSSGMAAVGPGSERWAAMGPSG